MDTKILRGFGTAAALLIGLMATSPALATPTGLQILGATANAVDVWTFSCPAPNDSAQATVEDVGPNNFPAVMQVVLGRGGFASDQETDVLPAATNGEGGAPSDVAVVPGGVALYAAVFKKTAAGVEFYRGNLWCEVGGVLSNPGIFRQINQ